MFNEIEKIFTSEDKTDMKIAMKRIIIEQFRHEMNEHHSYLLNPDNVSEWLEDAMQEIRDEFKEEYKNIIKEKLDKEMEEMFKSVNINK